MKSMLTLMLVAAAVRADDLKAFTVPADKPAVPTIVVRGTYAADAAKTIPIGDWRNYGVEGYTGKISWKYDALPELGTMDGKPAIIYGDVAVKKVEAELTPVRFVNGKFDTSKVSPGDALVGGVTAGRIKLKAIGLDKDGFPDEIATLMIEVVGPRGPPLPIPSPTPAPSSINYLLIVRKNAPATPEFTAIMDLPAWKELAAKGVTVKDVSLEYATAARPNGLGMTFQDGLTMPFVVRMNDQPASKKSTRIGLPVPLPNTDAGIRKLIEVSP